MYKYARKRAPLFNRLARFPISVLQHPTSTITHQLTLVPQQQPITPIVTLHNGFENNI